MNKDQEIFLRIKSYVNQGLPIPVWIVKIIEEKLPFASFLLRLTSKQNADKILAEAKFCVPAERTGSDLDSFKNHLKSGDDVKWILANVNQFRNAQKSLTKDDLSGIKGHPDQAWILQELIKNEWQFDALDFLEDWIKFEIFIDPSAEIIEFIARAVIQFVNDDSKTLSAKESLVFRAAAYFATNNYESFVFYFDRISREIVFDSRQLLHLLTQEDEARQNIISKIAADENFFYFFTSSIFHRLNAADFKKLIFHKDSSGQNFLFHLSKKDPQIFYDFIQRLSGFDDISISEILISLTEFSWTEDCKSAAMNLVGHDEGRAVVALYRDLVSADFESNNRAVCLKFWTHQNSFQESLVHFLAAQNIAQFLEIFQQRIAFMIELPRHNQHGNLDIALADSKNILLSKSLTNELTVFDMIAAQDNISDFIAFFDRFKHLVNLDLLSRPRAEDDKNILVRIIENLHQDSCLRFFIDLKRMFAAQEKLQDLDNILLHPSNDTSKISVSMALAQTKPAIFFHIFDDEMRSFYLNSDPQRLKNFYFDCEYGEKRASVSSYDAGNKSTVELLLKSEDPLVKNSLQADLQNLASQNLLSQNDFIIFQDEDIVAKLAALNIFSPTSSPMPTAGRGSGSKFFGIENAHQQ